MAEGKSGRREDDFLDYISTQCRYYRNRDDYLRTVLEVLKHNSPTETHYVLDHIIRELR